MAKIEDFIDLSSKNIKEYIEESYKSNRHFEWVSLTSSFMEQLLKSFLFTALNIEKIEIDNDLVKYVKNVNFGTLLKICFMKRLLSKELYQKMRNFSKKRNLILHNLLIKNEELKGIDLPQYYKLGQDCLEGLANEWARYIVIKHLPIEEKLNLIKKAKEEGKI